MQWKQIKTLFILCFLILNVYLLFMFFDKQKASDYGVAETQSENSTITEQLEAENITISADLPAKEMTGAYISANQKMFSEEEQKTLDSFENQESEVIDSNFIISRFEKPVAIPENADSDLITEIVKDKVLLPDQYTFGAWNKQMNVLFFFQQLDDRAVYYNQSGIILVFLNEANEMTFYTQTMLGQTDKRDTRELIDSMTAISVLYNDNLLWSGDDITKVNLGLNTRIPLESGEQVFAPTWTITVEGSDGQMEHFYVNAIENLVSSNSEAAFLMDTIPSFLEKVERLPDDNKLKGYFINELTEKLSLSNRSESE